MNARLHDDLRDRLEIKDARIKELEEALASCVRALEDYRYSPLGLETVHAICVQESSRKILGEAYYAGLKPISDPTTKKEGE